MIGRSAVSRLETGGSTDAELFVRYRDDGDIAAFELLFKRHRDALVRHVWLLSGNQAIAEDVSQYCWMRIIESSRDTGYKPQPGASLRSYLFTLGRNRFIDEYRRKHVEVRSEPIDDHGDLESGSGNAFEGAAADEERGRIEAALGTLPDEQREVVALWIEGYSIREMSEMTGAPADTVTSRRKYAMKKLRALLDRATPGVTHEGRA